MGIASRTLQDRMLVKPIAASVSQARGHGQREIEPVTTERSLRRALRWSVVPPDPIESRDEKRCDHRVGREREDRHNVGVFVSLVSSMSRFAVPAIPAARSRIQAVNGWRSRAVDGAVRVSN